ncbi:hypothetical protein K435DRAFT_974565 [Dendrothele bispora CBS 962.96]|uniref:Uncharacterized protein n=1 Tax=Dendrothele bispora (strain CBS 962.96) TaxID=1314807 RepID=A0A4S8KKT0_DENBC|nr:hypothetical protein K435DRAFT_974565 [Dendrothele bispora CBS 962.96]
MPKMASSSSSSEGKKRGTIRIAKVANLANQSGGLTNVIHHHRVPKWQLLRRLKAL